MNNGLYHVHFGMAAETGERQAKDRHAGNGSILLGNLAGGAMPAARCNDESRNWGPHPLLRSLVGTL
jgi:hypothetical protein